MKGAVAISNRVVKMFTSMTMPSFAGKAVCIFFAQKIRHLNKTSVRYIIYIDGISRIFEAIYIKYCNRFLAGESETKAKQHIHVLFFTGFTS